MTEESSTADGKADNDRLANIPNLREWSDRYLADSIGAAQIGYYSAIVKGSICAQDVVASGMIRKKTV